MHIPRDEVFNGFLRVVLGRYLKEYTGLRQVALVTENGTFCPIPNDTKLLSKVIEDDVFRIIRCFCVSYCLECDANPYQNKYPDVVLRTPTGEKIAVDVKTTYYKSPEKLSGFTLGTYKGYFRDQHSTRSIWFPYKSFKRHFVVAVVYQRNAVTDQEYELFHTVPRPATNFWCFLREKFELAGKVPGSGNTTNIGSIKCVRKIKQKIRVFESRENFESYWVNYTPKLQTRFSRGGGKTHQRGVGLDNRE
jgi:hypothetical protein